MMVLDKHHSSRVTPMTIKGIAATGKSHRGSNRRKNDDRFLVMDLDENNLLLAVSDGMGGHPGGDIAAEDIISCLKSINIHVHNKSTLLTAALSQADSIIRERVEKKPGFEGMGATATAAIIGHRMVHWAHIGDSRLYLLRDKILRQITRDHTFLQDLIDAGDISAEDAVNHPMCHVLDQCVGCIDSGVDSGKFEIHRNDILLACTDGLTRAVGDDKIAEILSSAELVSDCTDNLIEASLQAGNLDDVTIAVAL